MNKNTVYILQKDCLDAKAGDEFEFSESSDCYSKIGGDCQIDYLSALFVENNPEWFKPKEEVNESKPTEQFQWTDELVGEFGRIIQKGFCEGGKWDGISKEINKFKQSKSKKEEPQWEILSFKNLRSGIVYVKKDNGKFNSGNGLDWDLEKFDIKDHEIINSVKRFPDNTVWSVDDDTQHGKISGFKIAGSTMIAEIKNTVFPYDYPLYLSELKAPKEEQVPIKVEWFERINPFSDYYWYQFRTNQIIPNEKSQYVKSAIEDVINNKYKPWKMYQTGFTSEELLQARRDAFDESRKTHPMIGFKHDTFEDYINSLK